MGRIQLVVVFMCGVLTSGAFAAAPPIKPTSGRSAKKMEADRTPLAPPQVLEVGDNMIGPRAGQGSVFDSQPLIGVNYERMLTPNVGLGGFFGYATYSATVRVGPYSGTWNYDVYALGVMGSFHADLFKVRNLDTYVTAGIGRTIIRSSWSSSSLPPSGEADASSTYLLGYANARYFINSKWAFVGSIGLPLNTLSLGMDYLF